MSMRKMVVMALAAWVMAAFHALPAAGQEPPRMPKDELKAMLGSPEVVLIDVRAATDWFLAKKKIRTAVRKDPRKPEEWMNSLPRDRTIVLYCA